MPAPAAPFGIPQQQEPTVSTNPVRVAVTGAAGQIGYQLAFRIASGQMLGANQPVILQLLEIAPALDALKGVAMELDDCAFPTLAGVVATDQPDIAFKDTDYALLVGAKPRGPGMERADLLMGNAQIFSAQGKALNQNASRDIKILVVGNPANTNALIAQLNAPDLNPANFTAMTRLDHNRAMAQLAANSGKHASDVSGLIIWGNHSATQVPDYKNVTISGKSAVDVIGDTDYLQNEFIPTVAKRGAAIIAARGKSSAASAANGLIDHVKSLLTPTPEGEVFSSCVCSDGNPYGIPEGLIFSFPCRSNGDGTYEIVPGFELDEFLAEGVAKTTAELESEREVIKDLLG